MTKAAQSVGGPGPRLLTKAIDEAKIPRARVATILGVSRQHISVLCMGEAVPSLDLAIGLEELLSVPCRAWVRAKSGARFDPGMLADRTPPRARAR